ncbi:hypothetical protein P3X46_010498 [Hevea brasiliensis]|uniref:Uncharacterized protein n=1 Tax=Hevea brasiliensis TaxID=3981 RepID=A0ABQ9MI36_HEVBR|nr:hypothetical protein P3X46_010498 [Hevea brasiliensis]
MVKMVLIHTFLLATLNIFTIATSVTTMIPFIYYFGGHPLIASLVHPTSVTNHIKMTITLYGLWPINIGGPSPNPNKCEELSFDSIHFPILGDLNKFWLNLDANKSNTVIWEHEINHFTKPIIHFIQDNSNSYKMLDQVYFCLERTGEQFQGYPLIVGEALGFGCEKEVDVVFPLV